MQFVPNCDEVHTARGDGQGVTSDEYYVWRRPLSLSMSADTMDAMLEPRP